MKNHTAKNCRVAIDKICKKCGLKGHFAKKCKTRDTSRTKRDEVKLLQGRTETCNSSSSDDDIYVFVVGSKESVMDKFSVNLTELRTPIEFLIDSGCMGDLNIIDEYSYNTIKKHVKLNPYTKNIYPYIP